MQKRKLQVFVSSTFIDLKEERQSAVEAILNAGHIPAGMELFKAGDESQWNIIKDWIEESDVYMLIVGGRYGSIEPKSGKSYTQLEYEYAIELGKPFFAIVIKDDWTDKKAKKKGVKIEDFKEVHNLSKLQEFKKTVLTKIVKFAEDLKDIKLAVGESLNEMSRRDNLKGWVKADDTDYSSISEELARLSKENSELKSQLAEINVSESISGKLPSDWVELLEGKRVDSKFTFMMKGAKNLLEPKNYLDLFMAIANGSALTQNYLAYVDIRYLMHLNFITQDGILTERGTQLLLFIDENELFWYKY
jgi:nucleoside 2-deoxyribosyltransferase